MPGALISDHDRVPAVAEFATLLDELVAEAGQTKPATIEPALQKTDFNNLDGRMSAVFPTEGTPSAQEHGAGNTAPQQKDKTRQFAVIETAVRGRFDNLIATTAIDSPEFVQLWNLLDLVSILSDQDQCDPALLFWLIEEMLDSQTISQCQKVFDFLESRRQRITSRHFKQKHLVILRSCNELLRRLSRAEDTAFCGRVFIFMFQSFPLGDKSSVNLRGEYHIENVTAYDHTEPEAEESQDKMDVDKENKSQPKAVSFDSPKPASQDEAVKPDALYPIFWSLQKEFSQPRKLFDASSLEGFKRGLEATLKTFKSVQDEQEARPPKSADDHNGNLKRKRETDGESGLSSAFNPKYLTSRDLFELEISDLSFRRHILVQAFIIVEFLLSLSPKAKEKLATIATPNKSVMYLDQVLSEEDVKWAADTKKTVEDCLKFGEDGPQFHRMIDTVLARDKNWVRWKTANCPSIELPPLPAQTWANAQEELHRMCRNKRLKPPMGSLPLEFMDEGNDEQALAKLKSTDRYELPELASFERKIADDDFEIEMPTNEESKNAAIDAKASKSWRALRIAAKTRLGLFDKISDPDKIDAIFGELEDPDASPPVAEAPLQKDNVPSDQRPIVLTGPSGVGKSAIVELLLQRRPGAFVEVVRHTTRKATEGEVEGQHFHFVEKQAFNILRDGDALLEYSTVDEVDYGTSRKVVEAITSAGKVPLLSLDQEATQQVRDMGFEARFVLVLPPSRETLEERLRTAGKADEEAQKLLTSADAFLAEGSTLKEGCDSTIVNQDVEIAFKDLEGFVYGTSGDEEKEEQTNGDDAAPTTNGEESQVAAAAEDAKTEEDIAMADAAAPAGKITAVAGNTQEGEDQAAPEDGQ